MCAPTTKRRLRRYYYISYATASGPNDAMPPQWAGTVNVHLSTGEAVIYCYQSTRDVMPCYPELWTRLYAWQRFSKGDLVIHRTGDWAVPGTARRGATVYICRTSATQACNPTDTMPSPPPALPSPPALTPPPPQPPPTPTASPSPSPGIPSLSPSVPPSGDWPPHMPHPWTTSEMHLVPPPPPKHTPEPKPRATPMREETPTLLAGLKPFKISVTNTCKFPLRVAVAFTLAKRSKKGACLEQGAVVVPPGSSCLRGWIELQPMQTVPLGRTASDSLQYYAHSLSTSWKVRAGPQGVKKNVNGTSYKFAVVGGRVGNGLFAGGKKGERGERVGLLVRLCMLPACCMPCTTLTSPP
jgi:hypothetical protein